MSDTDNKPSQAKKAKKDIGDIHLKFVYAGFKAAPIHTERQALVDLEAFLEEHGASITKFFYTNPESGYKKGCGEEYRQLILKHCPNISQVEFEFTDCSDEVDDDNSQMMVKFLTALAPGLTSLETVNNLIGLHYLSCMGFVYENFSNKIKFVKTDELKPEELSVLGGDNNKNNPALSLEELVFSENIFLDFRKRSHKTSKDVALKPKSLLDLVKLTNLRRIDLPFLLTKDKIPTVTALPLLNYASIRLTTTRRAPTPSTSSFIENLGRALANVRELKITYYDPGLMVLGGLLKACNKLEKLDLTEYHIHEDYKMGLAYLAGATPTFKQLDAKIDWSHDNSLITSFAYLIKNTKTLTKINIIEMRYEDVLNKVIAATIHLTERVTHEIELNLHWSGSPGEELKANVHATTKPDNLKINFIDK